MVLDKRLYVHINVRREDQLRLMELFPACPVSHRAFTLLLDRYETLPSHDHEPLDQVPHEIITDAETRPLNIEDPAQAHYQACPLRAFPIADLGKYPLTLDIPPKEAT